MRLILENGSIVRIETEDNVMREDMILVDKRLQVKTDVSKRYIRSKVL